MIEFGIVKYFFKLRVLFLAELIIGVYFHRFLVLLLWDMVFTDLDKVLFVLFWIYLSILDEKSWYFELGTILFNIFFHVVFMIGR